MNPTVSVTRNDEGVEKKYHVDLVGMGYFGIQVRSILVNTLNLLHPKFVWLYWTLQRRKFDSICFFLRVVARPIVMFRWIGGMISTTHGRYVVIVLVCGG